MSVTSRSPLRMAGANLNSGNVSTGELLMTTGGAVAATVFSGAVAPTLTGAPGSVAVGADVLFFSGAGRLKDVLVHQGLVSGQAIFFYDAGTPVSGGPISASGHKVVGVVPASPPTGASGTFVAAGSYGYDFPFQSGLCCNSRSGQAGFTVSWVPESNLPNPG